jgi:CheY-like chemotaxis protein
VASVAVLIVDDQAPFRLAAAAVVEATPGFRVEAVAGSGEECVLLARRLHPDLVLLDVQLPGVDGWEASRLLRSLPGPPVVVVLSGADVDGPPARGVGKGTDLHYGASRPSSRRTAARQVVAPISLAVVSATPVRKYRPGTASAKSCECARSTA